MIRQERGRILAGLLRILRDFQLAEDCFAEALEAAAREWPAKGMPRVPGAWLNKVARRKAFDCLRRKKVRQRRQLVAPPVCDPLDERLTLMFTCCHPALSMEARVALTLRTLGGLTTPEIARAFLVGESTMAQRIVRAQRKIQDAGIPYRVPPPEQLEERLEGVLAVLYLIFNEGYWASSGSEMVRLNLCHNALDLAELLHELMPRASEVAGLYALMLFQHARSPARADGQTLEEQDRSLWDTALLERGVAALAAAREGGPYSLQAAIAGVHCAARRSEETNWTAIRRLYDMLLAFGANPVVELNRAVAVGMEKGPAAGLDAVQGLESALQDYALLWATRADFHRRSGQLTEAFQAYERALALEENEVARRFLLRRLAEIAHEQSLPPAGPTPGAARSAQP